MQSTEKGITMCQTCSAPPVIIHYADCPSANRAQKLGPTAQDEDITTDTPLIVIEWLTEELVNRA
jgi:hypothetical protein